MTPFGASFHVRLRTIHVPRRGRRDSAARRNISCPKDNSFPLSMKNELRHSPHELRLRRMNWLRHELRLRRMKRGAEVVAPYAHRKENFPKNRKFRIENAEQLRYDISWNPLPLGGTYETVPFDPACGTAVTTKRIESARSSGVFRPRE